MAITVTLTESEVMQGALIGMQRHHYNLFHGGARQTHGADPALMWQRQIEGALAEKAAAKVLDRYWSGDVTDYEADDVGVYQVRYTRHPAGRLLVHEKDHDDRPYILITGDERTFTLHGWLWGSEAKQQQWWDSPQPNRPAFCVPRSALHAIEQLPRRDDVINWQRLAAEGSDATRH